MPLHVATPSRRSFLVQAAAGAVGLSIFRTAWSAEGSANPNVLALLSDTHIPSSAEVEARGVNMTRNLQQVVRELAALEAKPSGVVINGDCAYLKGLPNDYANLAQCVAPLSDAGLPLHLTMGNHDNRGPLYEALQTQKPERPVVEAKHISVLETPHANWFLLDSLMEVDVVTGELGLQQREWLAAALKAKADKPAIVMMHHNPQFTAPAEGQRWTGLKDTSETFDLLAAHKQVKAVVFGHTHNWSITKRDHLHLINLPPVAYVFGEGKPNGWVLAETHEGGLRLKLTTIDKQHPKFGEQVDLAWA